jgi:phage recombination protein Bet
MEKKTDKTAAVATVSQSRSVLTKMAARYSVESAKLLETLKNTAFKGATNEQLMALCIVADQYRLNPFTKEIYAFPDKGGGIVPVVSIDGWLRIINEHPQFDGMEVECGPDECTVTIFRKDHSKPTTITEYMDEVKRNTAPWQSHPRRMLRHKTIIQCARAAFGFSVKDPDEAERIMEEDMGQRKPISMPVEKPAIEAHATPIADTTQPKPVDPVDAVM